jgi:multidrug efflux pump subunit AcrA (membrane-fusion protein)
MRSPGRVEVVEGLAPGELVIAEGLTSVRPGDEVKIRTTREAAAPR